MPFFARLFSNDPAARGGSRSAALIVAGFIFCAGFLVFWPTLDSGWDESIGSTNASYYSARIVRTWERFGFTALHGEPCLTYLPFDGENIRKAYRHHPPLFHWLLYLTVRVMGYSEQGVRMFPVFAAALSAAFIALAATRIRGPLVGLAAGVTFCSTTMYFVFGRMVNTESATLAAMMAVLLFHDMRRGSGFRARLPAIVAAMIAALFDWQGTFVVLAVLADELLRGLTKDGVKRVFWVGIGATAGVLVTVALYSWWAESFAGGIDSIIHMRQSSVRAASLPTDWWTNQWDFLRRFYTAPLVIGGAVALPFLFIRARRGDGIARLALAAIVPGILNVFVFRFHAHAHEFWTYYAMPYFGLYPAALLAFAVKRVRGRTIGVLIVVAWIAACVFFGIRRTRAEWKELMVTDYRLAAARAATFFKPGDLVMRADAFSHESFYFDFLIFDEVDDVNYLEKMAAYKKSGKLHANRIFYLMTAEMAGRYPDLRANLERFGDVRQIGDLTILTMK